MTDEFSPLGKPAFLTKETAESVGYVGADEVPSFDNELNESGEPTDAGPSRGIITRYREIARLHAFGKTNNEICRLLGYTPSRISLILLNPFVQSEISLWRERMVDEGAVEIMKSAAKDGALRIHKIILDPNAKDSLALDASKFAIEKTHGKAKQEVSVESGTLSTFMQMLQEMKNRGETIVDVQALPEAQRPTESVAVDTEHNRFDSWLDTELK